MTRHPEEPAAPPSYRPTWAEVDLDAVRHNVAALAHTVRPAAVCAVVKADAYGHGAVPVARAALEAGAAWLAVALVEEGLALRAAGIAAPVLLLSEPPPGAGATVVRHHLTPTVYSHRAIEDLAAAVAADPRARGPLSVHLKVDTGMHRVGAQPDDAVHLALAVAAHPDRLVLGGVWTHFAVADEPRNPFTTGQIEGFDGVVDRIRAAGIDPGLVHAANSAGGLVHPRGRLDLVRCGIATYGLSPAPGLDPTVLGVPLRPVLRLVSRVSHVKVLPGGARVSYGHTYELGDRSVVATVPIGYADGVPRRLSSVGGEVLIGGVRYPLAGRVTMDQVLVDCGPPDGPGGTVRAGDEVVLLGRQAGEEITAWDWAVPLDTIAYEITCGIGPRVPRRYRGARE